MDITPDSQQPSQQSPVSLQRFRLLLEYSDIPVAIYNHTEHHFVDANLAACSLIGIDLDQLPTTSADDAIRNLDVKFPSNIPHLAAGIVNGRSFNVRVRTRSQAPAIYDLYAHPVRLEDIDYILMIAHDITDHLTQQQTAETIQQRNAMQRKALAAISIEPAFFNGDTAAIYKSVRLAFDTALHPTWSEVWVRRRSNNNWFHCFGDTATKPIDASKAESQAIFSLFQSHEPIVIANMGKDNRVSVLTSRIWSGREEYTAVFYPIFAAGILAGTVIVWRPPGNLWFEDELAFIAHVGEHIAHGLNNFTNQRTMTATSNVSNAVMNMLNKPDLDSIFTEIMSASELVIGATAVAVFYIDDSVEYETLQVTGRNIPQEFQHELESVIKEWIKLEPVAASLCNNQPVMVYRETQPPGNQTSHPILRPDFYQAMLLPMVYEEKLQGGLILIFRHPRRFLNSDMMLLSSLLQQSMSAMEIVRLLDQLDEEQSHLALLFRLNQLNTRSMHVDEIAQNALSAICKTLEAELGILIMQTPDSEKMTHLASFGLTKSQRESFFTDNHSALDTIRISIAQRRALFSTDLLNDPDWAQYEIPPGIVRSYITVPIFLGQDAVAAINLGHPQPNRFTTRHLRLVESASATVSNALIHAQLIANERATLAAEHEMTVLAYAAQQAIEVLGESLDVDKVLDRILETVAEVIDAEVYNIILIEGDHGRIVRSRGYTEIKVRNETVADLLVPVFEFESFKRMIRTGEPVIIDNTLTDPEWVTTKVSRQARAYIGAAIRIGDETVGFINASSLKTGSFKAEDAQRLSLFAGYVALALRNAQTYQQTSDYASELEKRVTRRTRELQMRTGWAEAMINSTHDGILVLSHDLVHVQSNRVMKRLMRQTLSEQDSRLLRNTMKDLAREQLPAETQLELTGMVLDLRATAIEDETNSATLITVHDITHLRALDRMKSQFVSDVSHELRTPLATIGLYANLMRKYVDPTQIGYLDALNTELEALTRMVESILQVSRYESDRYILSPEPTDLNIVCAGAVGGFEPTATAKGLTLTLTLAKEPVVAQVDISAFKHVISHVIENAVIYTKSGTVDISTEITDIRGRQWAVIAVRDTGIGIPDDELPHIFERFYRGEVPRKLQISGGGMGLPLAQIITQQHGGYISVTSTANQGSEFRINLPVAAVDYSTAF